MFEKFNSKYFDIDFSQEKKCYNLGFFGMLVVYAVFGMAGMLSRLDGSIIAAAELLLIVSYALYYIGIISENYALLSTIAAVLYNIVFVPYSYVTNGRLVSGIFILFIYGFLYIVITSTGLRLYIMLTLSVAIDIGAIVYVYYMNGSIIRYVKSNVVGTTFVGLICSTVLIGNLCGISVKKLIQIFEEEQNKATAAVHKSEILSDSKDKFLANMSHEIRTPMNAILGTSQLLLENDLEEDQRDKVLNILNASNALLSSINDMLDITRIETGVIVIEEEEYDFGEMLSDIVNMIAVRVMDRNIEFLVKVDSSIPRMMYGDGKRLRQVFINILNNAVKYTKEGIIELTINSDNSDEKLIMLSVSVKDTGVGIKEADKAKLFTEFERLDTSNSGLENVEGTGLGLSICKEILKAMEGEITFDSTYHQGSEFKFNVPQKRTDSKDQIANLSTDTQNFRVLVFEKSQECDDAIKMALSGLGVKHDSAYGMEMFRQMFLSGNYTHIILDRFNYESLEEFLANRMENTRLIVVTDINQTDASGIPGTIMIRPVFSTVISDYFDGKRHSLIRRINVRGNFIAPDATVMTVDDNLTNLRVVENILSKYKMKVITASGGKEALLKLANEKVDIIFLDYMMPEMDGVDTLKNIRAMNDKWTDDVPIVALTANAVGGVREMLLSEGFDDYLSKPVEISKLERTILKYLP